MPGAREQRRLAAVLAADVVGYSRMMEADEAGTLGRLKAAHGEVLAPAIAEFNGRIVKTTGDGALAEFPSAVDAVRCAVAVQSTMAAHRAAAPEEPGLRYRIGIHLGDVIVDDGDIFGDGVNIAARLEGLAAPGGVALSGSVQEQTAGKAAARFIDAGEQRVKNISRPLRVWLWQPDGAGQIDAAEASPAVRSAAGKIPLVAVLRFGTGGGDPDVEDVAESLADDLTTAFAGRRGIEVVARGAAAGLEGVAGDLGAVRQATNADYVLTGRLRRSGARVRITAELVDAESGAQLWSSRYDREWGDTFALVDEMTERIALAARTAMNAYDGRRFDDRPESGLTNAERRARAAKHFYKFTRRDFVAAERLLDTVLASDPEDAMALAMQAFCLCYQGCFDIHQYDPATRDRMLDLAARAVQCDRNSDYAYRTRGMVALYVLGDCESALADARRALALSPQYGLAIHLRGEALIYGGHPEEGIPLIRKLIEYDPRDPINYARSWTVALGCFATEAYPEALSAIEQALSGAMDSPAYDLAKAAILARLGRDREARRTVDDILSRWPRASLATIKMPPYGRAADRARYLEALREAGLPAGAPSARAPS